MGHEVGALLGRRGAAAVVLQPGELTLQRALERGEAGELGEIPAPGAALLPLGPRDLLPRDADGLALTLGEIERLHQRERSRGGDRGLSLNDRRECQERQQRQRGFHRAAPRGLGSAPMPRRKRLMYSFRALSG